MVLNATLKQTKSSFIFKVLVSMYADHTVLFSDNSYDLQKSLNFFQEYCTLWKLNMNISKTKIVIFGRGKLKIKITLLS